MARHSVSEAARLCGKSPRTIYKHIRAGTLSAQRSASGTMTVETSELIRAYGEIHEQGAENATDGHSQAQQMQAEIERLRSQLAERDEVNQLLRQQNDQLARLLEDHSPGRRRSSIGTLTEALADRIRGGGAK